MATQASHDAGAVGLVRGFNRFYTKRIGVLHEGLLQGPYTLAESRVLYELAHRPDATAAQVGRDLELDPGYLSRIVRAFIRAGLVQRTPSAADGRERHLRLTGKGKAAFARLDGDAADEVRRMLRGLPQGDQRRLVEAMRTIERVLGPRDRSKAPIVLRPPNAGDLGWVVHRHGALYAEEYHWDERFEALVAQIVAGFVQHYDPRRERCWIAEVDGEVAGSVFLVKKSATVAKLRLLLVEPSARGLGIGGRLTDECIRFAKQAGYRRITLWTNSVLTAARRVYRRAGFRLVAQAPLRDFGHDLVAETWDLDLTTAAQRPARA